MGAIPNKLPGFQDVQDDHEARARFEAAWDTKLPPERGWHLSQMFEAMERGELQHALRPRREPRAVGGRLQERARAARGARLPDRPGHPHDEDLRDGRRGASASSASWCEADGGTVTNSERRVQLMHKAIDPPGQARDDQWIISELAKPARPRLGPADAGAGLGRAAIAEPDARRHELRAAEGARRDPVAVPERGPPRLAVPAWPAVGGAGGGAAGAVLGRPSGCRRSTSSTTSSRSG